MYVIKKDGTKEEFNVDKIIAAVVVVSMSVSLLFQSIPGLKNISSGFQIILLTVLISAAAAVLFPVKEEQHES